LNRDVFFRDTTVSGDWPISAAMTGFALALLICAAFVVFSLLQERYDRHGIFRRIMKALGAIVAMRDE
jgi:hypothetical protein